MRDQPSRQQNLHRRPRMTLQSSGRCGTAHALSGVLRRPWASPADMRLHTSEPGVFKLPDMPLETSLEGREGPVISAARRRPRRSLLVTYIWHATLPYHTLGRFRCSIVLPLFRIPPTFISIPFQAWCLVFSSAFILDQSTLANTFR